MKSFFLFSILAISLVGVASFADEESPFSCTEKTVAIYSPGAHWADLQKYFDGHVGFIMESMKNGKLDVGGPFLDANKAPEGGLLVANLTDRKAAEALFGQDPLVANQVAKVEYKVWNKCALK